MSTVDAVRWASMSLAEQMANTGSEVGRSAKWLAKGKRSLAYSAYMRALDLMDMTIAHGRKGLPGRDALLKELLRARDCYAEAFNAADMDSLEYLDRYFSSFSSIYRRL